MSTNHKFRVFLSAVSSEFEKARSQVACDLRSRGLEVKVQEDFRQEVDSDTTLRKLHDYIQRCDAVVCIVGGWSGALPPEPAARPFAAMGILPPELAQASYTQWEFFFARHHHKRLSRYLANPNYVPDKPQPTGPDSPELQSQFVAYLLGQGLDYTPFSTVDELCRRVLREDWPQGGVHATEPFIPKGLGPFDAGNTGYGTSPDLARDLRAAASGVPPKRKSALPKIVAVGLPLLALAVLWLIRLQDGLTFLEPGLGASTMPKVEIHYQRADEEGTYHVLSERDAPLRNGDKVQVHVNSVQPVYIYVFWYDSQGKTSLLWPDRLPASGKDKFAKLSLPRKRDEWLPISGSPGNEMLVVAVSDSALKPDVIAELEDQSALSKTNGMFSAPMFLPVDEIERGPGEVVASVKSPLNEQFEHRLQSMFKFYRVVVFPHQ